jgi:uncharacterized integral membrane protein
MAAAKQAASSDRQTDDPSQLTAPGTDAVPANADRRRRQRVIAAALIGALVAVFALINLNDVKVHWLVTTNQTPLIVVVVVAFLLGILADRLLLARAKRKRGAKS